MIPSISVLSNLNIVGALVLDKNITDFPSNPKIGTMVIKDRGLYAYVNYNGMETWFPLIREVSASFVHTQGGESLVWTINHNLNTQDLWYQIQDAAGAIISPAKYENIDRNTLRLTFTEAITGTVLVVGASAIDVPTIKASLITIGANVRIDTSGMTINGDRVITGTTMSIGDGSATKISYTDKETLHLVAGVGVELGFDDVNNKVTINAPGGSITPSIMNAAIDDQINLLASVVATKLDALEVTSEAMPNKVLRTNAQGTLPASITGNAATANLAAVATTANYATQANSALHADNADFATNANNANTATVATTATSADSVEWTNVKHHPTTFAGYGIVDIPNPSGSLDNNFAAKTLSVSGDILPTGPNQNIGSVTNRFKGIYVDEAHLSVNTLYLGDTAVMGTSADTINIKADPGQSINIKTTGVGSTLLSSEHAVLVSTSGLNSDVIVQATGAGSEVRFGAASSLEFTAPDINTHGNATISGNQTVGGSLTVSGSLVVNGLTTTVNSTTVTTKDNIIVVNAGQVGSGVSSGIAGLSVDRGDAPAYQMVFDETDDMFKVGMNGSLQTIASQNFVAAVAAPVIHSHANATQALAGFMSALDKVKLDASAVQATTYSKSEVDTIISNALETFKSHLYSFS